MCIRDSVKTNWQSTGYEVQVVNTNSQTFGLPQNRVWIVVVALNTLDPQEFSFDARAVEKVFITFRALLQLCYRKPECASAFLYDDDHRFVEAEFQRRQEEKVNKKTKATTKKAQWR